LVPAEELETIQKRITGLFHDPLCRILIEKSFFTTIQLEALLIDYLTYQNPDPAINQVSKATARQFAKGRTRGSYNRVLRQSKSKLEKALCSVLLLGYLGILGDARTSKFNEISEHMQEYLEVRQNSLSKGKHIATAPIESKSSPESETELRERLYSLLSGRKRDST
jgi:hypothetical protein